MSQTVNFDAGTYNISFQATQRIDYQTQDQTDRGAGRRQAVAVDHTAVPTTPTTIYTYAPYQTANFTVTAGAHTVDFLGMAPARATVRPSSTTPFSPACAINDGSFEEPALAAQGLPGRARAARLAVRGVAGVSANNSGFTAGNPECPRRQPGRLHQGHRQHESIDRHGRRHLQHLVHGGPAQQYQSQYESLEILVDGGQVGTATPSSTTYGLYDRRISRSRPGRTPSSSWA